MFKKDNYGYLKGYSIANKNDEKAMIRKGILDVKEVRSLTIDVDKSRVDLIRKLILNEEFDKAVYVACQIETEEVFNKCIMLMEKLGFSSIAKKTTEMS